MKAKRYIYLLLALFSGSTGLIGALNAQFTLLYAIFISIAIVFIAYYVIIFIGYVNFRYIKILDRNLSWSQHPVYRATCTFSLIIIAAFLIIFLVYTLIKILWNPSIEYFNLDFWSIILRSVVILSLIYTVEEAFRFMWRVNKLSLDAEKRKNEQTKIKLEALRKQLNPHFLFNCFNVLAELVHIDSEKSDEFVTEMGKIYRYVLDQKKDFIVTLSKELEFIQSFIFLQQIRFENNLVFKLNIGKTYFNYFIPPLTLELLVENAIKHNIITDNSPLIIEISVENQYLIVKNNYQPRTTDIPSTKIGLKNLKEQYELISNDQPDFFIKNGTYIAKIPLLNP